MALLWELFELIQVIHLAHNRCSINVNHENHLPNAVPGWRCDELAQTLASRSSLKIPGEGIAPHRSGLLQ